MKTVPHIFLGFFLISAGLASQTLTFKDKTGWGIKDGEQIILPPVYDTVFAFDASEKVCLACYKTKTASANKFIKVTTIAFSCNYFNKQHQRLQVKTEGNDTCSIFILGKNTVRLYNDNPDYFTVSVKNRKNLISKDFKQLTYKGYYDIVPSPDPAFYLVQNMNEGGVITANVVDLKERPLIPDSYSSVKLNPYDSLIIACSSGLRPNGADDILSYSGKKLESAHRHIDMATKNFIIHKIFEPKEYYIIYNIQNKEEKILNADEIQPWKHDEILIRSKNDWYLYDLATNEKKPYKPS